MTDRAVTEIVGFILVFSLVLGTVSIVYVGGFAELQDTRDFEKVQNAERAFDVLSTNLRGVAQGDAPSRATEIKLSDASLRTGEPTFITINTTGMNSSAAATRPITYQPSDSDSTVIYEAGSVIRADGDSAQMVSRPDFVFGPNQTVIRVIELRGGKQSVGGDTTTLVRSERRFQEIRHQHQNESQQINVTIRVEPASGHAEAWRRYLDDALTAAYDTPTHDCSIQGSEVVCTDVMTNSMYFAATGIDIELV
ncbi:MAG: hypothetical protein ACI8UR_002120 [Natronomonas sp.]|jgi:hypothetical protein|uniref:DUF7289 family protein n=1 Tax=Natronomonas sp. TaxID=2184060 RepID=UPI003989C7A6